MSFTKFPGRSICEEANAKSTSQEDANWLKMWKNRLKMRKTVERVIREKALQLIERAEDVSILDLTAKAIDEGVSSTSETDSTASVVTQASPLSPQQASQPTIQTDSSFTIPRRGSHDMSASHSFKLSDQSSQQQVTPARLDDSAFNFELDYEEIFTQSRRRHQALKKKKITRVLVKDAVIQTTINAQRFFAIIAVLRERMKNPFIKKALENIVEAQKLLNSTKVFDAQQDQIIKRAVDQFEKIFMRDLYNEDGPCGHLPANLKMMYFRKYFGKTLYIKPSTLTTEEKQRKKDDPQYKIERLVTKFLELRDKFNPSLFDDSFQHWARINLKSSQACQAEDSCVTTSVVKRRLKKIRESCANLNDLEIEKKCDRNLKHLLISFGRIGHVHEAESLITQYSLEPNARHFDLLFTRWVKMKRVEHLFFLKDDILVAVTGKYAVFHEMKNEIGRMSFFRIGQFERDGRRFQAAAGYHLDYLFAYSGSNSDRIRILKYPSFALQFELKDKRHVNYIALQFGANELLYAAKGNPDFHITIWKWRHRTMILNISSAFENDNVQFRFSHRDSFFVTLENGGSGSVLTAYKIFAKARRALSFQKVISNPLAVSIVDACFSSDNRLYILDALMDVYYLNDKNEFQNAIKWANPGEKKEGESKAAILWHHDGVLISSVDMTIRYYAQNSYDSTFTLKMMCERKAPLSNIASSYDCSKIAAFADGEDLLKLKDWTWTKAVEFGCGIRNATFIQPRCTRLLTTCERPCLALWRIKTGLLMNCIPLNWTADLIDCHPKRPLVVCSSVSEGRLAFVNCLNLKSIQILKKMWLSPFEVSFMSFDAKGQYLVVTTADLFIFLINIANLQISRHCRLGVEFDSIIPLSLDDDTRLVGIIKRYGDSTKSYIAVILCPGMTVERVFELNGCLNSIQVHKDAGSHFLMIDEISKRVFEYKLRKEKVLQTDEVEDASTVWATESERVRQSMMEEMKGSLSSAPNDFTEISSSALSGNPLEPVKMFAYQPPSEPKEEVKSKFSTREIELCDIVEVRCEELPHFARNIRLTTHQNHFTVHGFGDGIVSYWNYEPFACYFVQEVNDMTRGPRAVELSNDGRNSVIVGSDGIVSCCGIARDVCGHKSHERKVEEKRRRTVLFGAQVNIEPDEFDFEKFPMPWTEWHKRFTFLTEYSKARELFARVKKNLGEIQSSVINLMEMNEKIVFPEYRLPLLIFSPRALDHTQVHQERSDFFEELLLYSFYKKAKSWQLCSLKIKRKYWDVYPLINYKPFSVKAFRKNMIIKNFPLKNHALIEDIEHVKAQIRRTLDASMEMKGSIWRLPWLVCLKSFDNVVLDKKSVKEVETSPASVPEMKGDFHAELQMLMEEAEMKAKKDNKTLRKPGKTNQYLTYYVSVDPAEKMMSEVTLDGTVNGQSTRVDDRKDLISQLGGQTDLTALESSQVDYLFSTWQEERKVDKEKEKRKKFFTVRLRAAHSCSEITLEELTLLNYFHGSNAPIYLSIDPLLCSPLEINSPFQTHIQCPLIRRIIMHIKIFFNSELDNLRQLKLKYVNKMKETSKKIVDCIEEIKTKTNSRKIPTPPKDEDYMSEEEIYKLLAEVEPKIPCWEKGTIESELEDPSCLKQINEDLGEAMDEEIGEQSLSTFVGVEAVREQTSLIDSASSSKLLPESSRSSTRFMNKEEKRKHIYEKLIKEIALLRCDLLEPKRNADRCFRKFLKLRRALETDIIGEKIKLNWMARKKTIVLELSFRARQLKQILIEQENLLDVLVGTLKRLKARLDAGAKNYDDMFNSEKTESDKLVKFITNSFKDDSALLNSVWEVIKSRPNVDQALKKSCRGLLSTLIRALNSGFNKYKLYQRFLPEDIANFLHALGEWDKRILREFPKMGPSIVSRFQRKIISELSLELMREDIETDKIALAHTARALNECNINVQKIKNALEKCFSYCRQWIDYVKVQLMVDNSNFLIDTKGSCYDYANAILVDDDTLLHIFNVAVESGNDMIKATSEFKESTFQLKRTVTDYKWWQHLMLLERQEITAVENMRRNQLVNQYIEQVVRKKSEPRDMISRLNFEDNRIRMFFEIFQASSTLDVKTPVEVSTSVSEVKGGSQVGEDIVLEKPKGKNLPKLKFYLMPYYEEFMNEFEGYESLSEGEKDVDKEVSSSGETCGGGTVCEVRAANFVKSKSVFEEKSALFEDSGKKVKRLKLVWPALDQFDSCVQMNWLADRQQVEDEELAEPQGSEISEWNYYKMWLSENRERDALARSSITPPKEFTSTEDDLYEAVKSELGSSGDEGKPTEIIDELSKRLIEETDKDSFWLYKEKLLSEGGRSIYSLAARPGNENLVTVSLKELIREGRGSVDYSIAPSTSDESVPGRKSASLDVSYSFPDPPLKILSVFQEQDHSSTTSTISTPEVTLTSILNSHHVGKGRGKEKEFTFKFPDIKEKKREKDPFRSVAQEKLPKIEKSCSPLGGIDFKKLQEKSSVKAFMTNIDNLLKPPQPPTKLPEIPVKRHRAESIPHWAPKATDSSRRFSQTNPQVYFVAPEYAISDNSTESKRSGNLEEFDSTFTDVFPIKRSIGYSDLSIVGLVGDQAEDDEEEGEGSSKEKNGMDGKDEAEENDSERISGHEYTDDFPIAKSSTTLFAENLFTNVLGDTSDDLPKMSFKDMFAKYNIKEKIQDFFFDTFPRPEEEPSEKSELKIGCLPMDLSPEMTRMLYDNDSFPFIRKLPHTAAEFNEFAQTLRKTQELIPREQFQYLESVCEQMIARPRLDLAKSLEFKTAWEQWIESVLNEDDRNLSIAKKLTEDKTAVVPSTPLPQPSVSLEARTDIRQTTVPEKKDESLAPLIAYATKKYWDAYGKQYKARLPKKLKKQLRMQKKTCLKTLEETKIQTMVTIEEIKKHREDVITARHKLIQARKQLDRESKSSDDAHNDRRFTLFSEISRTKRAWKTRSREIELLECKLEELLLRKYPTFDYVIKN